MTTLEVPANETERLKALRRYDIIDTPADGNFDRITRLAATIFKVPISIISLVDTDRIWFKSHYGLSINQINRDPGLCASAILSSETYIIGDACKDPRSLTNPLVAGEFGLRFYAAVPLQTQDNFNLGTLNIIDKVPRTLSEDEKEILHQLAQVVMDEMELRLALRNAVANIKQIASDISYHLEETIKNVGAVSDSRSEPVLNYFDASRMFLLNIENQLEQL